MKRKEFMELFGEDPEDVFGGDWENILEVYTNDEEEPMEMVKVL